MTGELKYGEQELLSRMCDWCNKAERCSGDLRAKMRRLGASPEIIERILSQLSSRNFYDDARFAQAYAHDKSNFGKWGAQKIGMHLRAKGISGQLIQETLALLDDAEALENIKVLAHRKWAAIKAKTPYERKVKLMQHLMRKGFTTDQIQRAINELLPEWEHDLHP
jgi:regulatory protein